MGKVTDDEEEEQMQLKSILNKLTSQKFEKLFQQVQQVNVDNVVTLSGVILQILDKALMEHTFLLHRTAVLPELTLSRDYS